MKIALFIFCSLVGLKLVAQTEINFEKNTTIQALKAKAKKEKKLIFIDAYTTWCGPCKWISANIFTNKEVADYVDNLSIEKTLENELRDVESALKRIENGEYGICKYCQKPIDTDRLKARPESSSCVQCKNAIKKE